MMLSAWKRDAKPSLDTQSWKVVPVDSRDGRARDYLVKGVFGAGYHVMLCDGASGGVWEERLSSEEILLRLKALNPNVEAPLGILLNTLSSHWESRQPKATYTFTSRSPAQSSADTPTDTNSRSDLVTLRIQTALALLPLEWKFVLKRCVQNELSTHLISPLLAMVGELIRRQKEALTLMSRKDKEIQDYKDQGHKVSRKYLETGSFTEEAFESEMTSSSAFEEAAKQDFQAFCNPVCQQLYRDVTMVKKWLGDGNVDVVSHTTSPAIAATQTTSSPHSSPTKRPPASLEHSPSKNNEQSRREELERKLDEKSKPKKKKKKLM